MNMSITMYEVSELHVLQNIVLKFTKNVNNVKHSIDVLAKGTYFATVNQSARLGEPKLKLITGKYFRINI